MKNIFINETVNKVGEIVELYGWVDTKRDHKKIVFIDLRDRSGIVQVVGGEDFKQLSNEDVVMIKGLVKKRPEKLVNPKLATGTIEIEAKELKIISKAEALPFDIGKENLDVTLPVLLDYRPLTLRHPKIAGIFKVQATIVDAFRVQLKKLGFMEFFPPAIVPVATEGGAEVFPISYYDKKAYLGQSPQLYKQIMVGVFEKVFTVGKAYRAEPSVTTRHLSEYVTLDAEMGFISSFNDLIVVIEKVIKTIFEQVTALNKVELKMYGATIPKVSFPIPKMKMRVAQQIIFERTGRDHRQEPDLAPDDEREICTYSQEKYGSELIFITHYPTNKRPFYTYPDPENPEYTLSFDLIGRGVEWVTGGQRINDYQTLMNNINKRGLKAEDFAMYLQAFKYGMPPEGGFALGAERITMHILGLKNIREASLFPRDMERVDIRLAKDNKKINTNVSSIKVFDKIIELLDSKNVKYEVYEHKAVFTSEEAAKIRNTGLKLGAKAMVLYGDDKPIMLVLPADQKIDMKKFKQDLKIKNLSLSKPEDVKKITGIEIGAIPPFGSIFNIPLYVDEKLKENKEIVFNAGEHTKSIKMSCEDYLKIAQPIIANFSKIS